MSAASWEIHQSPGGRWRIQANIIRGLVREFLRVFELAPVLHCTGVMPESGLTYLLIANFICLVVIAIHLSDIKKLFRDIVGESSIRQHLESINRHLAGLGCQLTSIHDGVSGTKDRLDNIKVGIYKDTIASTVQELDSAVTNMGHIIEIMEQEKINV